MRPLILLTLLMLIFPLSHGKYCDISNGDLLHLICQPEDTKPIHIISGQSVSCETNQTVVVLRENIKTLYIATCGFDDFHLFPNFTRLRFSFFHDTKSMRKDAFVGMDQVEHISVGYSNAEVLESAFSDLPNLRQVDITDNKLKLSELAFKGAHQLKLLQITDWLRSSLPTGFFRDLNSLEYLTLGRHFENLTSIDFTGLGEVKWLRLNMNHLSNLTGNSFEHLKNLKYLNLNYNRLSKIESMTYSKLKNLVFLNLEGNQIEKLVNGVFSGLTNLRSLNLQHNRIRSIEDGTFSEVKNLKKLDLTNNRLTSLDEHTFQGLDNLQYLSLRENSLSTVSVNAIAALTKLAQLDLSRQLGNLEAIDLNAFPQFIDLQAKSVIVPPINKDSDDFERDELQWIKDILSLSSGDIEFYQSQFFGSFSLNRNDYPQSDLNSFSQNVSMESLVFGNLDLSDNQITSINLDKIK